MPPEIKTPTVSIIDTDTRDALTAAFEAGKAAQDAGARICTLTDADGRKVFVQLDAAGDVAVLENVRDAMQAQRSGPVRRAGISKHLELESFIAYLNRFKQAPSVVWADPSAFRVLAVLDYHPEGAVPTDAGWCGHRATYECPRSRQWKDWTAQDGVEHRQEAFGEFIEQHLDDTIAVEGYPSGLQMLEIARYLVVHSKGVYERRIDPVTGTGMLVCKDEHEESSTKIPRAFNIAIPVFEAGTPYRVECRIRFSMRNGVPLFAFSMHQRADIERDAFMAVRTEVQEKTALPVFAGAPEG